MIVGLVAVVVLVWCWAGGSGSIVAMFCAGCNSETGGGGDVSVMTVGLVVEM